MTTKAEVTKIAANDTASRVVDLATYRRKDNSKQPAQNLDGALVQIAVAWFKARAQINSPEFRDK